MEYLLDTSYSLNIEPPLEERRYEIRENLQKSIFLEDPKTHIRFDSRFLNFKEGDRDSTLVIFPPYGFNTENRLYSYFLETFATKYRNPIIAINHLSTLKSSQLNLEQHVSLLSNSDFSSITIPFLRALSNNDFSNINLYGYSMGGRVSASVALHAKEFGINIEKLIMVDPAGIKHTTLIDFIEEIPGFIHHRKDARDEEQIKACGLDDAFLTQIVKLSQEFIPSRVEDQNALLTYAIALQRKKLLPDVIGFLKNNEKSNIVLINGGSSKICPTKSALELINIIEKNGYSNRYEHLILEEEPHAIGINARIMSDLATSYLP